MDEKNSRQLLENNSDDTSHLPLPKPNPNQTLP